MNYPHGPRIGIREFTTDDLSAVHDYTSDPEVSQWSTWGPNTLDQTADFISAAAQAQFQEAREAYSLAAVADEQVVGSLGIWTTDSHDHNGELGYTFHRAHWGKGYATEAVALLLDFGFETLMFDRIAATCHPGNAGSIRVLEKCGFTLEGRLRSHRLVRGARRDSLLYSMLRDEYQGLD